MNWLYHVDGGPRRGGWRWSCPAAPPRPEDLRPRRHAAEGVRPRARQAGRHDAALERAAGGGHRRRGPPGRRIPAAAALERGQGSRTTRCRWCGPPTWPTSRAWSRWRAAPSWTCRSRPTPAAWTSASWPATEYQPGRHLRGVFAFVGAPPAGDDRRHPRAAAIRSMRPWPSRRSSLTLLVGRRRQPDAGAVHAPHQGPLPGSQVARGRRTVVGATSRAQAARPTPCR